MTDQLITYDDLNTIEDARRWIANVPVGQEAVSGKARVLDLLDRLRVEAEADQPPLPEGWVLHTTPAGSRAVFWHRDGRLHQWDDDDRSSRPVRPFPSSTTTPLRLTVTEADVEKAGQKIEDAALDLTYADLARAAFEAAGIEVRDV